MRVAHNPPLLFALLACSMFPGSVRAVSPSASLDLVPPDAVIGVKGGASWSRVTGDAHGTELRSGVVAGLHLDVPVNPLLALRGELLYHEMGARRVTVGSTQYEGQPPIIPVYQHSRRDYLELAFLAKVRPLGSDVYWLAGPTVGVLLSRSEAFVQTYDPMRYWNHDSPTSWFTQNQILNAPARTNGSFLLGVGAEVDLGATALVIEARYQWGLQDINRTAWFVLHDRSLTVMTGVLF